MIAGRSAEALYLAGQAAVELEERGGGLQAAIYYWIAARAAQEEKPLSALSNARQLIALAREAANPWLELRGLELGIALHNPVPEREVWRERARFILERIQEKSTLDAIQPAIRIFAQSLDF